MRCDTRMTSHMGSRVAREPATRGERAFGPIGGMSSTDDDSRIPPPYNHSIRQTFGVNMTLQAVIFDVDGTLTDTT